MPRMWTQFLRRRARARRPVQVVRGREERASGDLHAPAHWPNMPEVRQRGLHGLHRWRKLRRLRLQRELLVISNGPGKPTAANELNEG